MKRRVLILAPSAYPLGGVATWLDYLVPGLQRHGWDAVVALTSGIHHNVSRYLDAHPVLREHAVAVQSRTGTGEGRIRALMRLFHEMRPDVILVANIVDAYRACDRLRRNGSFGGRIAMTLHGIQPDFYADIRDIGNTLDAVIATNRLACALAGSLGRMPPERVHYAPYGIELPLAPNKNAGQGDRLRIAWVGRLEDFQKRVSDFCAIVECLERAGCVCEVLIAGDGPDRERVQGCVGKERRYVDVRWLGEVPGGGMAERVYAKADVLLVTSYWETGPIVAWEAMGYGLAVVSSAFIGQGLEGALRHGENCLLFPVGDADAAAACLVRLADTGLRNGLGRAGRRLVESRYTRELSVNHWHEALTRMQSVPPRGSDVTEPRRISAGRLDRWCGPRWGEFLRKALGRAYLHSEPGGEWPHTDSLAAVSDSQFWEMAEALDRRRAFSDRVPEGVEALSQRAIR